MKVTIMRVKDIDQYWERLAVSLSYFDCYLQGKAEYGINVSERGIQHIVRFTAEKTAREWNLNVNLVSALCRAVALCFPKKGFAELAVIKEIIRKNNMAIDLETLEINAIEYVIYESGTTITPELDDILHKYYSDDESVPEVNLVRFLQKYLNLNRDLLRECSFADSGKVVDEIMKRAKEEYATAYRLLPDPKVFPVPETVRKEIEENLMEFVNFYKDVSEGIYKAII